MSGFIGRDGKGVWAGWYEKDQHDAGEAADFMSTSEGDVRAMVQAEGQLALTPDGVPIYPNRHVWFGFGKKLADGSHKTAEARICKIQGDRVKLREIDGHRRVWRKLEAIYGFQRSAARGTWPKRTTKTEN